MFLADLKALIDDSSAPDGITAHKFDARLVSGLITRGTVALNFSPRNLTQVTSAMKPGKEFMNGIASVKRIILREGLY